MQELLCVFVGCLDVASVPILLWMLRVLDALLLGDGAALIPVALLTRVGRRATAPPSPRPALPYSSRSQLTGIAPASPPPQHTHTHCSIPAGFQELFAVVAANRNNRTRDLLTEWYLHRRPYLPDPAQVPSGATGDASAP